MGRIQKWHVRKREGRQTMVGKKRDRVVIYAPRGQPYERRIFSWLEGVTRQVAPADCLGAFLARPETKALVFYGESTVLGDIDLGAPETPALLQGKLLYDLASPSAHLLHSLVRSGAAACIGYRDAFYFTELPDQEGAFREAALEGVRAVLDSRSLQEVFSRVQLHLVRSIAALSSHRDDAAFFNQVIGSMCLRRNLGSLFIEGEGGFCIGAEPDVVLLTSDIETVPHGRVEIVDITPAIIRWLQADTQRLSQLTPDKFEALVADRLRAMGLNVAQVGSTYSRDGGIDFLAWRDSAPFPFLIAIQVKHSRVSAPVGPAVVERFRGVLSHQPIDIGVIVTNTRFTPTAQWVAEQRPQIVRLRDIRHLKKWLNDNFVDESNLADLPDFLELAPGIRMPVPRKLDRP